MYEYSINYELILMNVIILGASITGLNPLRRVGTACDHV